MEVNGFDFDPTARRHGGNPQSATAYDRGLAFHGDDRSKLLTLIVNSGGMTSKEMQPHMRKDGELLRPLNEFSGRLSEMRDAGLIECKGRRDGCGIWVRVPDQRELF